MLLFKKGSQRRHQAKGSRLFRPRHQLGGAATNCDDSKPFTDNYLRTEGKAGYTVPRFHQANTTPPSTQTTHARMSMGVIWCSDRWSFWPPRTAAPGGALVPFLALPHKMTAPCDGRPPSVKPNKLSQGFFRRRRPSEVPVGTPAHRDKFEFTSSVLHVTDGRREAGLARPYSL